MSWLFFVWWGFNFAASAAKISKKPKNSFLIFLLRWGRLSKQQGPVAQKISQNIKKAKKGFFLTNFGCKAAKISKAEKQAAAAKLAFFFVLFGGFWFNFVCLLAGGEAKKLAKI